MLTYRLCYNNIINNLISLLTEEDLMQYNSKIIKLYKKILNNLLWKSNCYIINNLTILFNSVQLFKRYLIKRLAKQSLH